MAYIPPSFTELTRLSTELQADYSGICGNASVKRGVVTYNEGTLDQNKSYHYAIGHGPFQHKINTLYKGVSLTIPLEIERMVFSGYGYNASTGKWDRPKCYGPVTETTWHTLYEYQYFTCEHEDLYTIDISESGQPFCRQ